MNKKIIAKNILLSIIAQAISFGVSFLLNLVVPRFIDELSYANWQSYILYVSYVGIIHFGLLDGIVLRYSQYDYDEIDKEVIRSQFKLLLFVTSSVMGSTILASSFLSDKNNTLIFIFVAIGMVIKNIYTYSSYSFQITNRIDKYVFLVITDRLIYGAIVIALLLFKVNCFAMYCFADLFSDLLGIIVSSFFNRGMYFGKSIPVKNAIQEAITNVTSGIILLLANWSAVFLVGSAKMIVQWHWNKLVFGKVSFAFSITNLFLTTAAAVSVVLFPSIKRMSIDELPSLYIEIRNKLVPLLIIAMILYFPGRKILDIFIPKYSVSLSYLGVLLPIIIPSCLVSLLTNNYFKAFRAEKVLLKLNVISVMFGIALFSIFAYIFNSLYGVLIVIVVVNIFRSIMSEQYIASIIKINILRNNISELVMIILFTCFSIISSWVVGSILYLIAIIIYLISCSTANKSEVSR